MTIISKQDLKGMKYYLAFAAVVMAIYIYSMLTGLRFMSFNESSHTKERTNSRVYYHK